MMIDREIGEDTSLLTRSEANDLVDKQKRYKQIMGILVEPMTAKEVAVEMHRLGLIPTTERNFSAPRLTEMSRMGMVEPVGKKKCRYSGRTVAVYARREA